MLSINLNPLDLKPEVLRKVADFLISLSSAEPSVTQSMFTPEELEETSKDVEEVSVELPGFNPATIFGTAAPVDPEDADKTIEHTWVNNDVDTRGLPWDARVHTRTKSKTADGNWKPMRGVEPALLKQVEDELEKVMAIPNSIVNLGSHPVDTPVGVIPPPPTENTAVAPPPPGASTVGYSELITRITDAVHSARLTLGQVIEVLTSVDPNLKSLPLLGARLDLVPAVSSVLDGMGV